jgi:hydroxyacylglutathione hydrolase
MKIVRHVNRLFSSNTYILFLDDQKDFWVIDPGDFDFIDNWIQRNHKSLKGVLLTHSHFDHIYGVDQLLEKYPSARLFASAYAKEGLCSEKINGSKYQDNPFTIKHNDIESIREGNSIELWNGHEAGVVETAGHGRDCITYKIGFNLFTGDSLIPGVKVFTKMKYGDKNQAEDSIKRILSQYSDDSIIWPGHMDSCTLGEVKREHILLSKSNPRIIAI